MKSLTLLLIILLSVFLISCIKIEDPKGNSKIEISGTIIGNLKANQAEATSSAIKSEFGSITDHGFCWGLDSLPNFSGLHESLGALKIGGSFSLTLRELVPNTKYFIRSYVKSGNNTLFGQQNEFITKNDTLPIVSTSSLTNMTLMTATSGGNITFDGEIQILARGVCWSTSTNPTIEDYKTADGIGDGNFISLMTGLNNNVTYYARAYATNAIGTSYGNEIHFTLYIDLPDTSVTDIDGNKYNTVKIGTQTWMAKNLMVSKYRDGSVISKVTDYQAWSSLISGAYCDWGNNMATGITYGHLYNFYAVVDIRQICPDGWHVPSKSDWDILINYLGGADVAGTRLKETGTEHWETAGGDNLSGFTGLAGSWRGGDGSFYYAPRFCGCFWTSTLSSNSTSNPWTLFLIQSAEVVYNNDSYHTQKAGNSIRCIKESSAQ